MAMKVRAGTRVGIRVETGLTEQGNPIFASRSFPDVSHTVTPEDIKATIVALANLQKYPLGTISYVESFEII